MRTKWSDDEWFEKYVYDSASLIVELGEYIVEGGNKRIISHSLIYQIIELLAEHGYSRGREAMRCEIMDEQKQSVK